MCDPLVGVIFMLVCHTTFPWLPGSYKKPNVKGYQLWLLVCFCVGVSYIISMVARFL
jgi:hypothetical protein